VQPWLYALAFIALMMAIAWAVDRRGNRMRRTLVRRPAALPPGRTPVFGRAPTPASGPRPAPGRTPQPRSPQPKWQHGGWQPRP